MELLVVVLACLAAAATGPGLHRVVAHRAAYVLAIVPAAGAAWLAMQVPNVVAGDFPSWSVSWLPSLDIALAFRLDGLSMLFALMVTVIGAFVSIYAGSYLKGHKDLGRFLLFLYAFMGSMLGLVLADDLVSLFVFWELTSITSFFLIGFHQEEASSRRSALQALLVTGTGGLALLAGLILLSVATGATTLSGVNAAGDAMREHALYLPALILVLAGAFTKSAQFPFHFWLPGAMVAPTPVSAYLHSATMVKAGVFLLARLLPSLGGTAVWTGALVGFGTLTFLIGTIVALRQTDLKRILAYTTVASLGFLTMLLGIGTAHAVGAAMAFLLAHALYKGTLFLVAGSVDHGTGTRDIRRLGGLRRSMPWTAAAGLIAALSFAGLPPLFGFIAKEAVLETLLESRGGLPLAALIIVLLVGVFLAAYIVGIQPFWHRAPKHQQEAAAHPPSINSHAAHHSPTDPHAAHHSPTEPHATAHESSFAMLLGPVLLASMGLLFGLWPSLVDARIINPAATAVLGKDPHIHLALWHGLSVPLLLSTAVVAVGAVLVWRRVPVRALLDRVFAPLDRNNPERGYDAGIAGLLRFADVQARFLQNGRLRSYLGVMAGFTAILGLVTVFTLDGVARTDEGWDVQVHELLLALIMVAAAFAVVAMRSRLAQVICLGLVGYGVATLFILFSAPDLAMTQFLFETLSVLLFVLVLWALPRNVVRSAPSTRMRDGVIAGAVGLLMTVLVWSAATIRPTDPVSAYYAAASYVEAHGRNVVNVILVDFRGLDTLGEITVLAVASLGVVALLRLRGGEA